MYPKISVPPRAVRFRKLNGSQARFYHLNFSSPSQADDSAKKIWCAVADIEWYTLADANCDQLRARGTA